MNTTPVPTTAAARIAAALEIGSLWEKGSMRRIYINAAELAQLVGLETTRYGTGNVRSATLNGERISNGEARRVEERIGRSKIWIDADTGEIGYRDASTLMLEAVEAHLAAAAADVSPEAVETAQARLDAQPEIDRLNAEHAALYARWDGGEFDDDDEAYDTAEKTLSRLTRELNELRYPGVRF